MPTSDRAYLWPCNCRSLCTAAHSRLRRSWPLTARLRRANGTPSARHWERVFNLRRVLNRKRVHKEWQLIAIDVMRQLHMNLSHSAHVKAVRFDIRAHRVCIGQCRRSPQQRRARSRGTSSSEIEVAKILVHLVAAPRRRRRRNEKEDEDNKNTSKRRRSKHGVLERKYAQLRCPKPLAFD